MALIHPMDFLSIKPVAGASGGFDPFATAFTGMGLAQEARGQRLANEINQAKAQYAPEAERLAIEFQKAQIARENQLTSSGYAAAKRAGEDPMMKNLGTLESAQTINPITKQPYQNEEEKRRVLGYLQQSMGLTGGTPSAQAKVSKDLDAVFNQGINPGTGQPFRSKEEEAMVKAEYSKQQRMIFNAQGPDAKREYFRMASAAGMTTDEAEKFFMQGGDIREKLKSQGIDPNEVEANPLPTARDISRWNDQRTRTAEVEGVTENMRDDISMYGPTIAGYSPELIADMTKAAAGDKAAEKRAIKFLGANALQPEIAAGRIAGFGGNQGIELTRLAMEGAISNFKVPGGLVTSNIRKGITDYIGDKIKLGTEIRGKALFSHSQKQKALEKEAKERAKEGGMSGALKEQGNLRQMSNEQILQMLGQ